MGASQSRAGTRKRSSSQKVEVADARRESPERPALRIRVPPRTNTNGNSNSGSGSGSIRKSIRKSNSNSSESSEPFNFDESLRPWNKIERKFLIDRTSDHYVFMFYDSSNDRARVQGIDTLFGSREVMDWAGSNYYKLTQFCGDKIDPFSAYTRYAGIKGKAAPKYDSALLLSIRNDGRILGFATVEDWNMRYPYLNDICVDKKHRGIGREIIDTYMRYAKANGAESLGLSSVTSAVPFYQRLGFDFDRESLREAYKKRRYDQYDMSVSVADYMLAD